MKKEIKINKIPQEMDATMNIRIIQFIILIQRLQHRIRHLRSRCIIEVNPTEPITRLHRQFNNRSINLYKKESTTN